MSVLHLSIATSGLPGITKAVWCPRMCATLCDADGSVMDGFAVNIRAEGRHIEAAATRRHGITTALANRTGVDEAFVLTTICGLRASGKRSADRPGLVSCARTLVAWNADFVCTVIDGLFARHGEPSSAWRRPGLTVISLQEIARPWCKLPPDEQTGQYGMPTRDDAAFEFLGSPRRDLPHAVDANLDLERRIYAALCERGAIAGEMAA